MMDYDVNELKNANVRGEGGARSSNSMDYESCKKVVEGVRAAVGLDSASQTMAAIAAVCQRGGTNRTGGTVNASFTIKGKTVTAGIFQQECKKQGGTARQFARTMGTTIHQFADYLQEEGDLARQMAIEKPQLTDDQRIWCSNFQTTNPSCPPEVREWLVKNYSSRFKR